MKVRDARSSLIDNVIRKIYRPTGGNAAAGTGCFD
jgi:hypothetical protein